MILTRNRVEGYGGNSRAVLFMVRNGQDYEGRDTKNRLPFLSFLGDSS
jgi:hypothetical protein